MKEHSAETLHTWNLIAKPYQDMFMHLNLYNHTYDFICDGINKPKASVLEIGCGPGNITNYLLSKRPNLNIYGIDAAPNMVALAKQNNPTARFEIMDCREILKINAQFDAIVCGFCLPYLTTEEANKLITDAYTLLNNEALFYLSFVHGKPENSGWQTGSNGLRVYFNYYTLDFAVELLQKKSFEVIKNFEVSYPKKDGSTEKHQILIAKKS